MPFNEDNEWKPNNPKQIEFLRIPTSVKEGFFGGGAGSGKALALTELIPTPLGYKQLRDIHPGDFVYASDGRVVRVLAESEIFTDHKCYKIHFDSGVSVVADANHSWVVHKNQLSRDKLARYQILTSQELFESKDSWSIPTADALDNIDESQLLVDPYTLGVWLGDGNSSQANFTSVDQEIVDRVSQVYQVRDYKYNYQYGIYDLKVKLRELNLLNNKHIPEQYFICDPRYRLELLKGIMDTDGTISATGSGIELSLSDKRLADDSLKLIRGLGIKASCTVNKSVLNGKNYKDRYRIKFSTNISVFHLPRKRDRQNLTLQSNNRTRTKWHYITKIEETETVPTKCIQVSGGLFLVSEACIETHNSELLCMYALVHGWHTQEGFKQLFLRRTYGEIKNEIWPRTKLLYRKVGGKPNESDLTWTFPREDQYGSGFSPEGGIIKFSHCQHEDDVHLYDGMEINLFTPDELTSFTEYIYTYIGFTRVRTSNPKLPAIIRASGMPGDIGHAFVKKRFVDPAPSGGILLSGRGGNKRIYIHSTYKDNVNGDPNYGHSLEALPNEAERRAKKYGDWSTYEGQVFDEFRDRNYPGEPDNAIHVVDPFDIPKHWPRICAIDWGYAAMCSVGWAAISPEPRVYVYRHQFFYREKIEEWAPKVKLFIDKDQPNDVVICHSANQHRGDPHSIIEQVSNAFGEYPIRLGERDRVAGKNLLHEFLRWRAKGNVPGNLDSKYDEAVAQWLIRNKGLEAYKDYSSSFNHELEAEVLPKLRFFNDENVKMIWDALKMCNYAKSTKDGKKQEDVAEFDGDDPYDMLRMLVHAADRFFNDSISAQEKLNRTEKVLSHFQQTGDMTAFYRNMRRVDSEVSGSVRPISRFHRGRR